MIRWWTGSRPDSSIILAIFWANNFFFVSKKKFQAPNSFFSILRFVIKYGSFHIYEKKCSKKKLFAHSL